MDITIDVNKVANKMLFQLCLELDADYDCLVTEHVFMDKKATLFDSEPDSYDHWNVGLLNGGDHAKLLSELNATRIAMMDLTNFVADAPRQNSLVTRMSVSFMRISCDVADRKKMLDWLQMKEEMDHPENDPAIRRIPLIGAR